MAAQSGVALGAKRYDFRYAPTLRKAAACKKPVRIVWGPVESGKTVWSILQLYEMMCTIPRCLDGIRRSRFLIVRTTEGELERGIMRTWKDMFPEDKWGPIQGSMPAIHRIKFMDVEAEVEFFAFEDDSETVLKKLRSTEYTAVLVNEGQFVPLTLFLALRQRSGRYPRKIDCPDYDREKRIIMDMNAPRTPDHWILYMLGEIPIPAEMSRDERYKYRLPDDWEIFKQPGVVTPIYGAEDEVVDFKISPDAENLPYQDEKAILSMCKTGDLDDILRDYCNRVIVVKQGVPRYPKFNRMRHISREPIKPIENLAPIIGYDPGLTGAATFWQKPHGRWRGIYEMNSVRNTNLRGASAQGEFMLRVLRDHFPWYKQTGVKCWGDPYGSHSLIDETTTYFNILQEMGLIFQSPAAKDNPTMRHEVGKALIKTYEYGDPNLLICPVGMPTFIDAIESGAVMKQVKRQGEMVTVGELVKNNHSHIIESAEYAWWGEGGSIYLVEKPKEEDRIPARVEAVSTKAAFSFGRREAAWPRR